MTTSHRPLLGVNIDHVATLRQARGVPYPSPVEAALLCERAGADGIPCTFEKIAVISKMQMSLRWQIS